MKSSFISLALFAASAFAIPQEEIAGQFAMLKNDDALCPGAAAGTVYTDPADKQYQIYCSNLLTGTVLKSMDTKNFSTCIGKCDEYNMNHMMSKKHCKSVVYGHSSSPQCQLLDDFGGFFGSEGVNSAVHLRINRGGNPNRIFKKIDFPQPHNWVAGFNLYPNNLLEQLTGRIEDYTTQSWSDFVLNNCKRFKGCTTSITFAAASSGPGKGRHWFGFLYGGGHSTLKNFTRADRFFAVRHSTAFTVPK